MKKFIFIAAFALASFDTSNQKVYDIKFTEQDIDEVNKVLGYTYELINNSSIPIKEANIALRGLDNVYKKINDQVNKKDSIKKK